MRMRGLVDVPLHIIPLVCIPECLPLKLAGNGRADLQHPDPPVQLSLDTDVSTSRD